MKTSIFSFVVIAVLAWGGLPAQTPTTPTTDAAAGTATTSAPDETTVPPEPEVLALEVKGDLNGWGAPVDLQWNGTTSRISARATLANGLDEKNPNRITLRGTLKQVESDWYLVSFTLSVNKMVSNGDGADGKPGTAAWQTFGTNGSINLRLGETMTLLNDQGKKLTITLTKVASSVPAAPPPG